MSNPTGDDNYTLEPLPSTLGGLPEPVEFQRTLREALNTGFARERALAGGETLLPEQSYRLHRMLGTAHDTCKGYKAAFEFGRKLVGDLQAELLSDVHGESDGVPNGGLTVPDAEGDIRLTVASSNVHTIDVEDLYSTVCASVIGTGPTGLEAYLVDMVNGDGDRAPEDLPDVLAEALTTAMRQLVALGKFEPQITKVRTFSAEVARQGDDALAAQVTAAVRTTRKLDGVKMTRKPSK